jgi:hypothetical protein
MFANQFKVMLLAPPFEDVLNILGLPKEKGGLNPEKVLESQYGAVVFQALRYLRGAYSFDGICVPYLDASTPFGDPRDVIERTDQLIILRIFGWESSATVVNVAEIANRLVRDEFFLTPYYDGFGASLQFSLTPTHSVRHLPFDTRDFKR